MEKNKKKPILAPFRHLQKTQYFQFSAFMAILQLPEGFFEFSDMSKSILGKKLVL